MKEKINLEEILIQEFNNWEGFKNDFPKTSICIKQSMKEACKQALENVINKVLVEYIDMNDYDGDDESGTMPIWRLKTNSSNEISIKILKESWNKEEVEQEKEEFIHLFFTQHYNSLSNIGFTSQSIREWIKQNL